jgi:hypothetical protein
VAFRPRLAAGLAFSVLLAFIYYSGAIKKIRGLADFMGGENLIFAQEYYGERRVLGSLLSGRGLTPDETMLLIEPGNLSAEHKIRRQDEVLLSAIYQLLTCKIKRL